MRVAGYCSTRKSPPVADDARDDPAETERHRRGLRFRKRDEYAFEPFKEPCSPLADIARVDRILLELGKFYNPLVHGPIVDLATRRRIVEHLDASQIEDARRLLDERLALYARTDREA